MNRLLLCLGAALVVVACGKKGNPLPPLARIPAAPEHFTVTRIDQDVYVRFVVPRTNIDGAAPADLARVEVYAITIEGPADAMSAIEPEALRAAATVIASEPVRRPLPPAPPPPPGMPPPPPMPQPPGADQGAELVFRESLTPEARTPVDAAAEPIQAMRRPQVPDVPRALVAPPEGAIPERHYFAVGVSARGRYGPHTAVVAAPLAPTSGPPSAPLVTVSETSVTLRWTPPLDARGVPGTDLAGVLPSRSLIPAPPPTTYDVYEVPRNATSAGPLVVPQPLTEEPTAAHELTLSGITLGVERCFFIRAVDVIDGTHVRGPASPVTCASFADVFAPAPPRELVAVAVPGGINLIWEPSPTADVAGYLVLRGEVGSDTLTLLTPQPVATPSYRDETVTAGARYIYAVVAVDQAGNRSDESNRVEEMAQ